MSRSYRDGGHSGSYKFSNRYSTRKIRKATRDFCNQVKVDVEIDANDDLVQEHNDDCDFKSGWKPLIRWLESRIGDKWDDVYPE